MPVKYEGLKPDIQILQNRYFSANELRETVRNLGLGVDNAEFKRLWDEEIIRPPDVLEPWIVLWQYDHAIQLIKDMYALKGVPDEYDVRIADEHLMNAKEIRRYRKYFVDTVQKGEMPKY
jgi:hypothetical protein